MISLSQAQNIIRSHAVTAGEALVPITEALGRMTCEDITARLTQPPFAASAMDGYAVRFADMAVGAKLSVTGDAPAGSPFAGEIKAGEAVRLFTGSVMPSGADHVIIQEDIARDGGFITVTEAQPAARNIRKAGIDFREGDILVRAGTRLGPADIALIAAGNHAQLRVRKPLTIALLASGDELREPGSEIKPGQIISSNQAALGSLFESWGMDVIDLGIAADDPADISRRAADANAADIIIPIGGASVGDHDHMRATFAEMGYETLFEKVAIRPGKPSWFARRGEQRVLGLPGNPASAYICANVFARTLLGLAQPKRLCIPTTEPIAANGPRDHFIRATVTLNDVAQLTVTPSPKTDSSLITPLARANALVHLAAHEAAHKAGDAVTTIPLETRPSFFEARRH